MAIAALRFNNPGNVSLPIRGYNGPGTVVGISGQPGYASFPTMADGLRAQAARLTSYVDGSTRYGSLDTIASLNSKYAEDPNWKNAVSRFSGIGVNDKIDPNNAQQMAALQGGIIRQETGKDPSVFGFSGVGSSANTNNPIGQDGLGYGSVNGGPSAATGGVETSVGTKVLSESYGADHGEVVFGNDDGQGNTGFAIGGTQGIDASSFTSARLASPDAGSFGLSGITSGGQTVGGTGNALSLDGATLDKGVTADSVTGGPVGFNAGGPVTANPDLVSATGKVASATKEGDQKITDGVKTAGQTIGQAITSQSQSWLDWIKDSFVRLAFIVTGLVLFAAALYYFARPQIDAAVDTATAAAGKGVKLASKLA